MDDLCESMEQLLERGERYHAPHSLRYVTLRETWYWTPRDEDDEDVRCAAVPNKLGQAIACLCTPSSSCSSTYILSKRC